MLKHETLMGCALVSIVLASASAPLRNDHLPTQLRQGPVYRLTITRLSAPNTVCTSG